ncbi:MAG: hypothetical protein KDE27_20715 [Planctomycetes bacterium]|nr:hypothetical protein [Planctomycetota bacterium]
MTPFHPFSSPAAIALLSGLLAAGSLRAQQTWIVDQQGSGQFLDIGAAVAAASDGDVILVRQGNYPPFVVDGKSLTIHGARVQQGALGPSTAPPTVEIKNLAAHQRVHLTELLAFNSTTPNANVFVHDCAGSVWIENAFSDSYGAPGLVIARCADVVLASVRSQSNLGIVQASGAPLAFPGARLIASTVHAYDCQFSGTHGVLQGPQFPLPSSQVVGGAGLDVVDSHIEVRGGDLIGGAGNGVTVGSCVLGGNGGDGLLMRTIGGSPPRVDLGDIAVQGGSPGVSSCGPTPQAGGTFVVVAGSLNFLPGTRRELALEHVVLATPATLRADVTGMPGDLALVFAGRAAPTAFAIGLPIHLGSPAFGLGAVVLDGSGAGSLAVPVAAASGPIVIGLQALVLDGSAAAYPSNPATLILP